MLLPFPKILLILLILSKNLPATARANIFLVFISIPPFRFCFRQDLQDLQDCFKQVEQEMQESLGPPSAGSGMATPVFLLLLLFSMLKSC